MVENGAPGAVFFSGELFEGGLQR